MAASSPSSARPPVPRPPSTMKGRGDGAAAGVTGELQRRMWGGEKGSGKETRAKKTTCPFCRVNEKRKFYCEACASKHVGAFRQRIAKLKVVRMRENAAQRQKLEALLSLRGSATERARAVLRERLWRREEHLLVSERKGFKKKAEKLALRRRRLADLKRELDKQKARKEPVQLVNPGHLKAYNKNKDDVKDLWKMKVDQLLTLYPIRRKDEESCSIVGIRIPDKCQLIELTDSNKERICTAFGYVIHVTNILARYLYVPLANELVFFSSKSYVVDRSRADVKLHFSEKGEFKKALSVLANTIMDFCCQVSVPETDILRYRILPNLLNLFQVVSYRRAFESSHPSNVVTSKPAKVGMSPIRTVRHAAATISPANPFPVHEHQEMKSGRSTTKQQNQQKAQSEAELDGWAIVDLNDEN